MKKHIVKVLFLSAILSTLPSCGRPYYTVQFKTFCNTEIAPIKVKKGSLISEPAALTKECYSFQNWNLLGKKWDFATDTVTSDITLRASWKKIQYKINVSLDNIEYSNLITPVGTGIYDISDKTAVYGIANKDDYSAVTSISIQTDDGNSSLYGEPYALYGETKDDAVVTLKCGYYDYVNINYVDSEGKLLEETVEHRTNFTKNNYRQTLYSYDNQNRLIKKVHYEKGHVHESTETYSYDDNSMTVCCYNDISMNNLNYFIKTYYNDDGTISKWDHAFYSDTAKTEINNPTYYENGNLKTNTEIITRRITNYSVYKNEYFYDDDNRLIKKVSNVTSSYDFVEDYVRTITYTYDEKGHLIKENCESGSYDSYVDTYIYVNDLLVYKKHDDYQFYYAYSLYNFYLNGEYQCSTILQTYDGTYSHFGKIRTKVR